jgi:transposase
MDVPQDIRQLIIHHHENGYSCGQIANMLNQSRQTVIRLVKRYKDLGHVQSTRVGRCGRHRLLSNRDERHLARASTINPKLTAREIRASVGGNSIKASLSTVKRALRRQGKCAYRPRKSPSLSVQQQRVRLKWCRKYVSWSEEQWHKVKFDRISAVMFDYSNLFFRVFINFR